MSLLDQLLIKTPGLWVPPGIDDRLSNNILAWRHDPNPTSEREVAMRLAKLSHTVIERQGSASGFSRASSAIENNNGNCIAHSEATIAFAALHGLRTLAVWDSSGATVLWPGKSKQWKIDPYFSTADEFFQNQPEMSDSLALLANYLISTEQGAYLKKLATDHKIEASIITGSLEGNPCPFSETGHYIETLLTPVQALEALTVSSES